jgi:integrase
MPTFADQAEIYLAGTQNRVRDPLRASTLRGYRSYLRVHLLPALGGLDLSAVGNASVKPLIARLSQNLQPATIQPIFNLIKQIVASDTDENGDPRHPRTWNSDFLDIPVLRPSDQHAPVIPRNTLQRSILEGSPEDRLLWAFLAGSGLRISEALAVHTRPDGPGNYWNPADRTVTVDVQRHPDGSFGPTKTLAGRRVVDLCRPLNDFLLRRAPLFDFLFASKHSAAQKRFARQAPGTGFHSFRRFRDTHLDSRNVPLGLRHYWLGHAMSGIDAHYVKPGSNVEERQKWAEQAGLGFELPQ